MVSGNIIGSLTLCFLDREDSPVTEVEPYIPFNINPSGMQPVLTATYLLGFPGILARLFHSWLIYMIICAFCILSLRTHRICTPWQQLKRPFLVHFLCMLVISCLAHCLLFRPRGKKQTKKEKEKEKVLLSAVFVLSGIYC